MAADMPLAAVLVALALEVTLLGRRDGTTCPKWVDMLAFLRPLDESLQTNKALREREREDV